VGRDIALGIDTLKEGEGLRKEERSIVSKVLSQPLGEGKRRIFAGNRLKETAPSLNGGYKTLWKGRKKKTSGNELEFSDEKEDTTHSDERVIP